MKTGYSISLRRKAKKAPLGPFLTARRTHPSRQEALRQKLKATPGTGLGLITRFDNRLVEIPAKRVWIAIRLISFRNLLLYPSIQIPCAFPFEGFVIDDIIHSRLSI